jgi:chloride channel protein, CIC family
VTPPNVLMGVAIGALSAAFIVLVRSAMRTTRHWRWWTRMLAAAVLIGCCALAVPQAMGIGYDIVNLVLVGQYAGGMLAAIAVVKLIASGIGIAAGFPGGLIGPRSSSAQPPVRCAAFWVPAWCRPTRPT